MKSGSFALAAIAFMFAAAASAQTIMPSEPPPGQLGAGQVVYVSCGPGKARKVTGGSDRNAQGVLSGTGSRRVRGPCVPMKS